jgi:hypothetical protein
LSFLRQTLFFNFSSYTRIHSPSSPVISSEDLIITPCPCFLRFTSYPELVTQWKTEIQLQIEDCKKTKYKIHIIHLIETDTKSLLQHVLSHVEYTHRSRLDSSTVSLIITTYY